ncbi:MAG TPA: deoxyribodipyrimidine photo-lyase [Gaiellaceae bacterium]|nr:deoxyribodipyrimidine photo-lyase [Gaiellaceae bacterium]
MRAVVLFTRDLRVHDNPALAAAVREADEVVPLFVRDPRIERSFGAARRVSLLHEALADLRDALRGALAIRRGDPVRETLALRPDAVYLSEDVSATAQRREAALRDAVRVRTFLGITVVRPTALAPAGADHYRVFTPYHRAWLAEPRRALEPPPPRIPFPPGVEPGELPAARRDPSFAAGGETAARGRMRRWLDGALAAYDGDADRLDVDGTSRLSADLHLGCVSPLELAVEAQARGGHGFVRQLAWRDFYAQLLRARPETRDRDFRPRGDAWNDDPDGLAAWTEGRTGYPVVDAGMRQLAAEGWLPNRARLITASFLVKHLYVDWREGARVYEAQLLDGDVANNRGNWQWVAGTGVDTRPNRVYNPTLQARRHDPTGDYVRRHVPELVGLPPEAIHEPWTLGEAALRRLGYPPPIVDHAAAVGRFRAARAASGRDPGSGVRSRP